jgi:hypothetical protein
MSVSSSIIAVARRFLFVREVGGPNRGIFVEFFLRMVGAKPGEPWCAAFASVILWMVYLGKPPLPMSASCDVLLEACRRKGYMVPEPEPGCLIFSMRSANDAHHVAIGTDGTEPGAATVGTIAGNTSEDGTSDNGDGVYEHPVSRKNKLYARMPAAA